MIRILTDSASDILPAEAAQLGVDVIPLNVTLEDGTVIRDGVDLTPSEYYEHMAGCKKLPTTSRPFCLIWLAGRTPAPPAAFPLRGGMRRRGTGGRPRRENSWGRLRAVARNAPAFRGDECVRRGRNSGKRAVCRWRQ